MDITCFSSLKSSKSPKATVAESSRGGEMYTIAFRIRSHRLIKCQSLSHMATTRPSADVRDVPLSVHLSLIQLRTHTTIHLRRRPSESIVNVKQNCFSLILLERFFLVHLPMVGALL